MGGIVVETEPLKIGSLNLMFYRDYFLYNRGNKAIHRVVFVAL